MNTDTGKATYNPC